MSKWEAVPPEPHRFPLPNVSASVGDLHTLLADFGIQGVTSQEGKTWVTFAGPPAPHVIQEIVRRVRGR